MILWPGCGDPIGPTLETIVVVPASAQVAEDESVALIARGHYTDGSELDITEVATWRSADPTLAVVSNAGGSTGLVTAVMAGVVEVEAILNEVSGSATITVVEPSRQLADLTVGPSNPVLAQGSPISLWATATYTDGFASDVTALTTWTSSNSDVATFDPLTPGRLQGLAVGTSTITAALEGFVATLTVMVTQGDLLSLWIVPELPVIIVGQEMILSAQGSTSASEVLTLTTSATWTSQDERILQPGELPGHFTALKPGSVRVSATVGEIIGYTQALVLERQPLSLQVKPAFSRVDLGDVVQLAASATYNDQADVDVTDQATWTTSDPLVADFGILAGELLTFSEGTVIITATLEDISASATVEVTLPGPDVVSLQVSPRSPRVRVGGLLPLVVTATYSNSVQIDATSQALWSSSNPAVASVSNDQGIWGYLQGLSPGTTLIEAQFEGVTDGVVVTIFEEVISLQEITIIPTAPVLYEDDSLLMEAQGLYSNGTQMDITGEVTWVVRNPSVARMDGPLLVGLAPGETTLEASLDGISQEAHVVVLSTGLEVVGLTMEPVEASLSQGERLLARAVALFSDQSTLDVTEVSQWTTSDSTVAVVINEGADRGLVTATGEGQAMVSAEYLTLQASLAVTVSPLALELVSLTIAPDPVSLTLGQQISLIAWGDYSDGSRQDLTAQVAWLSQNPAVALVDASGRLVGVTLGDTMVEASHEGLTARASVHVGQPGLEIISLVAVPPTVELALGQSMQLAVTAIYSDFSAQDVTAQVAWSSLDPLVASVQGLPEAGLLLAFHVGFTVVTASLEGVEVVFAVTVTEAIIEELLIEPEEVQAPVGSSVFFTATAIYGDDRQEDVTKRVIWSAASPAVARAGLEPGEFACQAQGATTINATLGRIVGLATLIVGPVRPVELEIAPAEMSVPVGMMVAYRAQALMSDGSEQDVTEEAAWSASPEMVVTVSDLAGTKGEATALTPGEGTVVATMDDIQATARLQVVPAQLTSLIIEPPQASLPAGASMDLSATAVYSDGTRHDLTGQADWQSSNPAVARVEGGQIEAMAPGEAVITAFWGGMTGEAALDVTEATLLDLTIEPAHAEIYLGFPLPLHALGSFTDGSRRDVTALVQWSSSDPSVVQVGNADPERGLALARGEGVVTITAQDGEVEAQATLVALDVALVSMQIEPSSADVPEGVILPLRALGLMENGSVIEITEVVTWISSDLYVLQVSNDEGSRGVAQAISPGEVTIQALYSGLVAEALVRVTDAKLTLIQVEPGQLDLVAGYNASLRATGIYDNGSSRDLTEEAQWAVEDESIVRLEGPGEVRGLSEGETVLWAEVGELVSNLVEIAVLQGLLEEIVVTPPEATVVAGLTQPFVATGLFSGGQSLNITEQAAWSVEEEAVASVDSHGVVTGQAPGLTRLTATLNDIVSNPATVEVFSPNLASVTIEPAQATVLSLLPQPFRARGHFSDGNSQDVTEAAVWSVGDGAVASVSNAEGSRGVVTGLGAGQTEVRALYRGVEGVAGVTVEQAALVSVEVSPPSPEVPLGLTQRLRATGHYDNGASQDITEVATWVSSDPTVADVSNLAGSRGLVTTRLIGQATVSAYMGSEQGQALLSVMEEQLVSVSIQPREVTLAVGTTANLTALGLFTDNVTRDLSAQARWTSGASAVAVVDGGRVTAVAVGDAEVRAEVSGQVALAEVHVTAPTLEAIEVHPDSLTLAQGMRGQVEAFGVYGDGSRQVMTEQVTWFSMDESVATVSNQVPGQVVAVRGGSTVIQAYRGGLVGEAGVTVEPIDLVALTMEPGDAQVAVGVTIQFTVMGTFSDGTQGDVTPQVTFSTTDRFVASVSNDPGTEGLAMGESPGVVTISASRQGVSTQSILTVFDATLEILTVLPSESQLALGESRPLTAVGTYSNGQVVDVTAHVTWFTDDEAVAEVSNLAGHKGVVTAQGVGRATIAARLGGAEGEASVVVE